MISSNPITAPQVERADWLFSDEPENLEESYRVLTSPSLRREEILAKGDYRIDLTGRVLVHTVRGRVPTVVSPIEPMS